LQHLIHGFPLSGPESGHTERRAARNAAVATVLFHPDFNRRLRNRTESADPFSQADGKKALAGLGLGHPYRRWGLSPRPENIGRPIWATYWELWRMAAAPASTFAIGIQHVPMPPPRNSGGVAAHDFNNYGRRSDPRGAKSARRTRMPRIRFRFVLLLIIRARDQLWTGRALPVDGLPVRLRGFRKSHHLIPTGPGRSGDCSRQRRVRRARVGLPCAYQPSYLNSQM
jgi:hypothetical protein